MKRLVNIRYPLCCLIGLVLGIFSAFETYFGNIWLIIICASICLAFFVICLIKKSKLYKLILFIALFIAMGFGYMQFVIIRQNSNVAVSQEVVITGRVCDLKRNGNKNNVLYLEDCNTSSGTKIYGKIRYVVFDGDLYETGDVLTLRGILDSTYPIKSDVNTFFTKNNVRYEISHVTELEQHSGDLKLNEIVRRYIYNVSNTYMTDNGDIMYALLTGDRNALDENKSDAFAAAGIIHLLAVSGLHVGFLVAIFCFVLRRFKLPAIAELAILLVPLIFYAYICSFSPSVMRAVIMLACAYLVRSVFGSYDMLTSMSFAAIIVLLISPLYLFDLGFQLSFLSVLGIATIYPRINRALNLRKRNKFCRVALNSIALSFSCSVATFFAVAINYGKVATLGVLINIVAIPLVTIAFSLGVFGMLPWIFHYVLWLADKLLRAVVFIAESIAKLEFSAVAVPVVGFAVIASVVFLFIIGGYVNLRKVGKSIAYGICAAIIVVSVALAIIPRRCQEQVYVAYSYNDVTVVATDSNNEMAIIGTVGTVSFNNALNDYCSKRRVEKCSIYIPDFSECNVEYLRVLLDNYKIDCVYLLDVSGNDGAEKLLDEYNVRTVRQFPNTITGNGVKVRSLYDGSFCGTVIEINGMKVARLEANELQMENIVKIHSDLDFVVLNDASDAVSARQIPSSVYKHNALPNYYGANKCGNFTITQKDGTISISFR